MFPMMRTQKDSTTGGDVPLVCLRGEYLTLLRSYSQPTSTQVCASSLSTGGSSGLAITCKKIITKYFMFQKDEHSNNATDQLYDGP